MADPLGLKIALASLENVNVDLKFLHMGPIRGQAPLYGFVDEKEIALLLGNTVESKDGLFLMLETEKGTRTQRFFELRREQGYVT